MSFFSLPPPEVLLPVTRGLSLVGTGLAAGITSSIPLWTYPTIFGVKTLSTRDRLHLWSGLFDNGKMTMTILIPLSTIAIGATAAMVTGRKRTAILSVAAATIFSFLPFTAIAIIPGVNVLKAIESDVVKRDGDKPGSASVSSDVDSKLWDWHNLHGVRVGLAWLAFGLVAFEAVW
ncbi:hypothetical protein T439DRAFT_327435 [Meredithblackwellia eburnea MCA 4105]